MTHEVGSFYLMTRLYRTFNNFLIMHYELLKAPTGVYILCNKYQYDFPVVMVTVDMVTIDCMAHFVIVMAFQYMNIIMRIIKLLNLWLPVDLLE